MEFSSPKSSHDVGGGLGSDVRKSASTTGYGQQHDICAAANTLSAILWKLRRTLELLLFRGEQDHHLLSAGQTRWIQHSSDDMRSLLELLHETEFRRVVEIGRCGPDDITLRDVATGMTTGSWELIFDAHRTAMLGLVVEVNAARERNTLLLQAASDDFRAAAAGLQGPSDVPPQGDGRDPSLNVEQYLRDNEIRANLALYARAVPSTLVDFLH